MTKEKIDRINELAKKSRAAEGLTEAEKAEQAALRQEYRDGVKANLEGQTALLCDVRRKRLY